MIIRLKRIERYIFRLKTNRRHKWLYNNLIKGEDFLDEIGFQKNGKRRIKNENSGIGYLFYSTFTLRDKGKPIS